VAQVLTLGQLPLPTPDVVLYTDGSASFSSGTVGWGVYAHSDNYDTSLGGTVVIDSAATNWVGASRPTHHIGEISAIYHALKWLSRGSKKRVPESPLDVNLLTDSEFCVRLFADNSIMARCNKPIIQRVRHLLQDVRRHHHLYEMSLLGTPVTPPFFAPSAA